MLSRVADVEMLGAIANIKMNEMTNASRVSGFVTKYAASMEQKSNVGTIAMLPMFTSRMRVRSSKRRIRLSLIAGRAYQKSDGRPRLDPGKADVRMEDPMISHRSGQGVVVNFRVQIFNRKEGYIR